MGALKHNGAIDYRDVRDSALFSYRLSSKLEPRAYDYVRVRTRAGKRVELGGNQVVVQVPHLPPEAANVVTGGKQGRLYVDAAVGSKIQTE